MEPVSPDLENDVPAVHGPSGHPLFPRAEHETGPDMRRMDLIHIERLKEDGTWEACPRVFKAHEIQSWKDIVEQFGGGVYRARAQCKKTYQWQGMTERKEFNGSPSRPFCEEPPKPKAPAPPPAAEPAPSAAPAAPQSFGVPFAPPGWTPPSGWAPAGWTPPGGWTPQSAAPNGQEPPMWMALLLKMLDRQQAPAASGDSLLAVMFKAQADRDAAMLKVQADRDAILFKLLADRASPTPTAGSNPLEMLREIKPLLHNTTAPGQFMQGIEVAKSLMQQSAPAAPQEDFATTFATLMRTLGPQGLPGLGAPSAPAAPAAAAPPPAPPAPAAPTLDMDDVIRIAARDRNMALRFIAEMRRNATPANDWPSRAPTSAAPSAPVAAPPPAPPASAPVVPSATPATPAPPPAPPASAPVAAPTPPAPPAPPTPIASVPASMPVAPTTGRASSPLAANGSSRIAPAAVTVARAPEPASATTAADTSPTRPEAASPSGAPAAVPLAAPQLAIGSSPMEAAAPEDANEDGSPLEEMALPDVPGLQEALANLGEEGRAMLMMFAGKGAPPDGEGGSGANGPPR